MIFSVIIIAEIALFMEMKKRIRIFSAIDIILAYILLYQFAYYNAEFLDYDPERVGLIGVHVDDNIGGVIFYSYIFVLTYISTLGLRLESNNDARTALVNIILKAFKYQVWILAALYCIVAIYLISVDYEVLWRNTQYLFLRRPESLSSVNRLSTLSLPLLDVVAILSAFIWSVSLFLGRIRMAIAATPLFAFGLIFELANSSRTSVVLLGVPAVVGWILLRRARVVVSLSFVALALYVLSASLGGRAVREFGISAIPDILMSPIGGIYTTPSTMILNLLQGIFVTMDGFAIPGEHPEIYKILSFSPLPTFIDGFANILRTGIIMISRVSPMSAITEVVRFGWIYTIVAVLFYVIFLRKSVKTAQLSPLLYLFTLPTTTMLFVQANAYPMRNVFRQAVYVYIFMVVAGYFAKRRKKLTPEAIAAAPLISRYRQQAGLAPVGPRRGLPPRQMR